MGDRASDRADDIKTMDSESQSSEINVICGSESASDTNKKKTRCRVKVDYTEDDILYDSDIDPEFIVKKGQYDSDSNGDDDSPDKREKIRKKKQEKIKKEGDVPTKTRCVGDDGNGGGSSRRANVNYKQKKIIKKVMPCDYEKLLLSESDADDDDDDTNNDGKEKEKEKESGKLRHRGGDGGDGVGEGVAIPSTSRSGGVAPVRARHSLIKLEKKNKNVMPCDYEQLLLSENDDDDDNNDINRKRSPQKEKESGALTHSGGDTGVGVGEQVSVPSTSGVLANDSSDSSDYDFANVDVNTRKRIVVKKGRKSEVDRSRWARNQAKKKRNSGVEYFSIASKKVVPARKVGPMCKDGCFAKIGIENIEEIHKGFWGIGNYDKQNEYLMRCISEVKFKRKYTKKDISKRPAKLVYKVTHASTDYEVCRDGFMSIFDIKRGKLDLIVRKMRKSKAETGVVTDDLRGKTVPPVNKIEGPMLDVVHEFIRSLPVVSSHYTRAKAPLRQYLPAGGSINDLFSEYQMWMYLNHPDTKLVTPKFFRHVFTKNYNIQFAPPLTDVCNLCSHIDVRVQELQILANSGNDTAQEIQDLEAKKEHHKEEAKTAKNLLNDPQNSRPIDPHFRAIAIDLQQQQPCPKMPVNMAYYASKLWFRNFCIYDLTMDKANMFAWDETVGSRGPDEIASCIYRWLQHVRETEGRTVTKLRIFADNCAGQNKNIYLILFFLQQIQQKLLKRVDLIFLVSGHSYMHCDRAFGVVEKVYKNEAYICSTPQYVQLLRKACKKNAYTVFAMERSHFLNFKELEKFITNRSKGKGFSKAKQFVMKEKFQEGFFIKNHYQLQDVDMMYIDLRKGRQSTKQQGRGRPPKDECLMLARAPLPFKYPFERKIKQKKNQVSQFHC